MYILVYSYQIPSIKLVPYCCYYGFYDDDEEIYTSSDKLKLFMNKDQDDIICTLVKYLRIPEMDSDITIKNRFAYTSICIWKITPKNLEEEIIYRQSNNDIIQWMINYGNINQECINYAKWIITKN